VQKKPSLDTTLSDEEEAPMPNMKTTGKEDLTDAASFLSPLHHAGGLADAKKGQPRMHSNRQHQDSSYLGQRATVRSTANSDAGAPLLAELKRAIADSKKGGKKPTFDDSWWLGFEYLKKMADAVEQATWYVEGVEQSRGVFRVISTDELRQVEELRKINAVWGAQVLSFSCPLLI